MRIVVLVTGNTLPDLARRRGDFDRWIREAAGPRLPHSPVWISRDVRTSEPLPGPKDADAFVITGSSASVTERAPWMLRAEQLVRDVVFARTPLLGICFGHQLIAQALGGEVRRNPRGREIGTMRVERTRDDPIFAGLPRSFDVNGTHVDVVARLPSGAEVLARTVLDDVASFRFGATTRAVQFHPEFDADVMRSYLRARAHLVASEGGDPSALLARVHGGTRGRDVLKNFVRSLSATSPEGGPEVGP
jgi:GMP synthase (glutamine-hydrolysing)